MIINDVEFTAHGETASGKLLATTANSLRVWLICDDVAEPVRLDQNPPKVATSLKPISATEFIEKLARGVAGNEAIYGHALNIVAYLQTGLLSFEQIVQAISETGTVEVERIERLKKMYANDDDATCAEQELIRLLAEAAKVVSAAQEKG